MVHAMPEWSNQRKDVRREEVAQQLLQEFCAAAGVQLSADELLYMEAHRSAWAACWQGLLVMLCYRHVACVRQQCRQGCVL